MDICAETSSHMMVETLEQDLQVPTSNLELVRNANHDQIFHQHAWLLFTVLWVQCCQKPGMAFEQCAVDFVDIVVRLEDQGPVIQPVLGMSTEFCARL